MAWTSRAAGVSLGIVVLMLLLTGGVQAQEVAAGAKWELAMLGVSPDRLEALRELADERPVSLAVVGQGGVGREALAALLQDGTTLTYHGCKDPGGNAHDTGQLRVILDLTKALGIKVHVHVFQPGKSFREVADAFRGAAKVADVVALFQSFWGTNAAWITEGIRESPEALFVSPYVESGNRPTIQAPQGHACKPWDADSIQHFVTAVPLAKRSGDGKLLSPSARGESDTEVVNFVAPSFYASGPGGTCPAGAVTAAVACFVYAASPEKPTPTQVVDLMRGTCRVDDATLTSAPPFTQAAADTLRKDIATLSAPPEGQRRTLDAAGVLNLWGICEALTAAREK